MSNWNHALEYVKGKFWAKLDADDWWEQHFIEDCYNIISKDENVGMVSGRYVLIDENDQIIPNSEYQLPEQFKNASTDFIWKVKKGVYGMFEPNLAFQGNGLIRSEILQKLGNYTLLPAGDTEMYFRIGAHYKIYFLDKLYHYYRIWSSNYTRSQVLLLDKADKNMHDARKEIFDYYFKQNKITKSEFDLFTKQNQFEYNKFLVAKYRKQNNINEALKILGQNFKLFPIATINFYISRIFNR
jgi:glycosyltransferase involved in cell wall biosynthesis